MADYSKKHPEVKELNEEVVREIKNRMKDGEIACAVAHAIAEKLKVSPAEVGLTADMLNIPIVKCQLGLFGYKPKKKIITAKKDIPEELKNEIQRNLEAGKLSCKKAWEIAKRLGIRKTEVSSACEGLGIKITKCQLGAF